MIMSEWIPIDPMQLTHLPPRSEMFKGVHIQLHVSPYDIPNAVRAEFNNDVKRLCIEFRYLTPKEETEKMPSDPNFFIHVGKSSGRISKIEVDVKQLKADQVRLGLIPVAQRVSNMIDRLKVTTGPNGNYELVKEVIQKKGEAIFG